MSKDWLCITRPITFPISEIEGVEGLQDVDGNYHVRLHKKTPTIDFVCADLEDAKQFYKQLVISPDVVDLDTLRFGK